MEKAKSKNNKKQNKENLTFREIFLTKITKDEFPVIKKEIPIKIQET